MRGGALAAGLWLSAAGCGGEPPGTGGTASPEVTIAVAAAAAPASSARTLDPNTKFYVRTPDSGAATQFLGLLKGGQLKDALNLALMEATPQAVWFTSGSPSDVQAAVSKTVKDAEKQGRVPVLVAYDIPFRDCAQYSAGGAVDTTAYKAWIDGFAAGIGKSKAVVMLEPDSLGIIPYNTTIYGAAEWCQPTVTDSSGNTTPAPGANPTERYAQINYAVDSLESKAPKALVYLDGTHSAWLGVGDAAYRLYTGGVQRAQGFFVNVSNYHTSGDNTLYGTWISDCIAAALGGAPWAIGHFDYCPSQYNPDTGYSIDYSPAYAATVTSQFQNMLAGASPATHFVIDTSRNGQGAWTPTASYPDAQDWCNPPGRGVGARPTASTGVALVDAYLWVKTPGESDGSCNRGITGSTTDPEWGGIVDPAAGAWFPQQALQLEELASPSLL
jgi:endoglucanase